MANTTRAGALSIHGTNPQVSSSYGREPRTKLTTACSIQYLVPTVIRKRVYDTLYWSASSRNQPNKAARKRDKLTPRWSSPRAEEKCFALNAATIIDRAVELEAVGGTYANTRPTEFICLVLKLLQLQPEREIVLEYLRAEEFK